MKRSRVAALAVALLSVSSLALPIAAAAADAPSGPPAGVCLAASPAQPGLFTPKPTPRTCFRCESTVHGTTPTLTGSGGNCTAAANSLTSQANGDALDDCVTRGLDGVCNFLLHVTSACTQVSPGVYQEQGHATYNCSRIIC